MHRNSANLCASSICWMWTRARESSLSVQQRQPLIERHHLSLQRSEQGFPWHLSPRSFILVPLFGTMLAQHACLSVQRVYHSHTTKLHLTPQTQAKVTHTLGPQVSPATLCHFESRHIWLLFCGYFGTSALSYLFADVLCSPMHSLYLIACACVWEKNCRHVTLCTFDGMKIWALNRLVEASASSFPAISLSPQLKVRLFCLDWPVWLFNPCNIYWVVSAPRQKIDL